MVAEGVNALRSPERGIILVTHYQRLLNLFVPDFVHVLAGGKIIKSGAGNLPSSWKKGLWLAHGRRMSAAAKATTLDVHGHFLAAAQESGNPARC